MKKSYLTCGGMAIIFIVILVVAIIFGARALQSAFQQSLYQELGFSSKQDYDDFASVMNEPFDATSFYENIYTEDDKLYVRNALTSSIELKNDAPLFLDNGYINIQNIDLENNAQLINEMNFTEKQFAYLEHLLFSSMFADADTEKNELGEISVLSFKMSADDKQTVVLKLKTTELKKSLKNFANALPEDLYIELNYGIMYETEWQTTNQSIHFNKLDDAYNTKCVNFFKAFMNSHPAKAFSDIFITLTNSLDKTIKSQTNFDLTQITIGRAL